MILYQGHFCWQEASDTDFRIFSNRLKTTAILSVFLFLCFKAQVSLPLPVNKARKVVLNNLGGTFRKFAAQPVWNHAINLLRVIYACKVEVKLTKTLWFGKFKKTFIWIGFCQFWLSYGTKTEDLRGINTHLPHYIKKPQNKTNKINSNHHLSFYSNVLLSLMWAFTLH